MLNPIHLQTLQTVLRTGSFADAARVLGYSGSAVSQQMSALERTVRTPLFERDAHGVRPTRVAQFIATRSREVLGSLRSLEDDLALLLDGATGHVRVGSFPTAGEQLVPQALSAFLKSYPEVEVSVDEGEPADLVPRLESRELDLALVYHYGLAPRRWPRGLRAEKLLVEDLLLLTPVDHPLVGASSVAVEDLARETWVTTQPGTAAVAMVSRLCAAAGFEPEVVYRSNNYAVIRGLVAAGLGVAIVPALGHKDTPGVVGTTLTGSDAYREVIALRSPAANDGAWREMVRALRQAAETMAAGAVGLNLPGERRCIVQGDRSTSVPAPAALARSRSTTAAAASWAPIPTEL